MQAVPDAGHVQSRSRRQQVIPLPQASSAGRYSQGKAGLPNRMPSGKARSGIRGRPPCGSGGSDGGSARTIAHNSSLTTCFVPAMGHQGPRQVLVEPVSEMKLKIAPTGVVLDQWPFLACGQGGRPRARPHLRTGALPGAGACERAVTGRLAREWGRGIPLQERLRLRQRQTHLLRNRCPV